MDGYEKLQETQNSFKINKFDKKYFAQESIIKKNIYGWI